MSIEVAEGRVWIHKLREFKGPPEHPLHVGLQWILEQLHLGNSAAEMDGEGQPVSLTLGRASAPPADSVTVEQAIEHEYRRGKAGYMNTDLYYAFELVALLRRIRDHTFLLDAPPILGRVPAETVEVLGEAIRCFLLGLARPCLSLCRLTLETVLRSKVPKHELLREAWANKTGELESLINLAAKRGLLSPDLQSAAHSVRKAGNKAVHGPAPRMVALHYE